MRNSAPISMSATAAKSRHVQYEVLAIGYRADPRALLNGCLFACITVAFMWPGPPRLPCSVARGFSCSRPPGSRSRAFSCAPPRIGAARHVAAITAIAYASTGLFWASRRGGDPLRPGQAGLLVGRRLSDRSSPSCKRRRPGRTGGVPVVPPLRHGTDHRDLGARARAELRAACSWSFWCCSSRPSWAARATSAWSNPSRCATRTWSFSGHHPPEGGSARRTRAKRTSAAASHDLRQPMASSPRRDPERVADPDTPHREGIRSR